MDKHGPMIAQTNPTSDNDWAMMLDLKHDDTWIAILGFQILNLWGSNCGEKARKIR